MTVYVDSARNPYGRMLMSHMVADGVEELFEMADRIGVARRHFQPGSFPHFDLSQSYRSRVVNAGAVVVDRYGLVAVMRRYRQRLREDEEELARLRRAVGSVSAR